jgi:Gpi16 subunit, GPI transamidase component
MFTSFDVFCQVCLLPWSLCIVSNKVIQPLQVYALPSSIILLGERERDHVACDTVEALATRTAGQPWHCSLNGNTQLADGHCEPDTASLASPMTPTGSPLHTVHEDAHVDPRRALAADVQGEAASLQRDASFASVRLESATSLRLPSETCSDSNRSAASSCASSLLASPLLSPLPISLRELLHETQAQRVLLRVSAEASSAAYINKQASSRYHSSSPCAVNGSSSSSSSNSAAQSEADQSAYCYNPLQSTMDNLELLLDKDEAPHSGPSGVSIHAYFGSKLSPNQVQAQWRKLLHQLVSRRILLAPLLSTDLHQIRRLQSIQPLLNSHSKTLLYKASLVLPFEASPLSGESLYAWSQYWPGWTTGLFHSALTPEDWSNFLLRPSASITRNQPRGYYMDLRASPSCHSTSYSHSPQSDDCVVSSVMGIQYSLPWNTQPGKTITLLDLLPPLNDKSQESSTLHLNAWNMTATVHFSGSTRSSDSTEGLVQDSNDSVSDSSSQADQLLADSLHVPLINSTSLSDTLLDPHQSAALEPSLPYWKVNTHIYQHGGIAHDGRLSSHLYNHHPDCSATVQAWWDLPLFLSPLWSTLRVNLHLNLTLSVNSTIQAIDWIDLDDHVIEFAPDDNHEGVSLYWRHILPPQSSLHFSLDYESVFLPFEVFPTDANRGFELPPLRAHFTSACPMLDASRPHSATLYASSHLILTPLPDRSMPFNVLSLVCTLYAFLIGSILNILVRKGSEKIKFTLYPHLKPPTVKDKLRVKLDAIRERLKSKVQVSVDAPVDADDITAEKQATMSTESVDHS